MKIVKLLSLITLLVFSAQAWSHSKLVSSEPVDQAKLLEAPKQITLAFNRKVRLIKLELLNGADEAVDIGFKPVLEKKKTFAVALPELDIETYQVKWIAMSGDSHKMKGAFTFTLATATDMQENSGAMDKASDAKPATAHAKALDQADPMSVANAFAAALSRADTELLKTIAAPEIIIFEGGVVENSFAEYAAGHMESDIAFMAKVERTVKSQQVVEDSKLATVITHSELRNKATTDSMRSMLETMLLKRGEAGWKIIHIHWSAQ
ncbi:MAG: copper resistance protein CopC [Thiolinea sp.]